MSGNETAIIGSADIKGRRKLDDSPPDDRVIGSNDIDLESKRNDSMSKERCISSNLENADQKKDESNRSKDYSSKSRKSGHHSRHRSDDKHHDKKKSSKKRHRKNDDNSYNDTDDSDNSSNSDEYSSYSDSDDDRRRRRHEKERKKKHENKKHKKGDDRSKDRKSKKKKHKKERRHDEKTTSTTTTPSFGQYGIIKASDMTKMQRSFEIWLSEVHGIHMSSSNIPRYELQQYFDTYREDYNTATLPHIKYYNFDKWELEEYEKQKRELEQSGQNSSALFNDERNHAIAMQRIAKQKEEAALQLVAATMNTTKIKEMQHQKQLQSQMQMAFKMGDHETYRKIKEKLQPPDK